MRWGGVSGTSNWSGDYFTSTGGVGFIVKPSSRDRTSASLQAQLSQLFQRDWNSKYAPSLDDVIKSDDGFGHLNN